MTKLSLCPLVMQICKLGAKYLVAVDNSFCLNQQEIRTENTIQLDVIFNQKFLGKNLKKIGDILLINYLAQFLDSGRMV